jgi:hypothetical protein
MLRNNFIPDIPRSIPNNCVELLVEYERKNMGQHTHNQRHWDKKYRTMWFKWNYIYGRLERTALNVNFKPNTPMNQFPLRMSLAALDMEERRKTMNKTVAAYGVFLHANDPAIPRRTRGTR